MSKKISFDSGNTPKQKPAVSSRVDYSMPITSDDDFSDYFKHDPDPLKTYSLRIIRGRLFTVILSVINIAVLGIWMLLNYKNNLAWSLGYGLCMIASCVLLIFGMEGGRKLFAFPACLIGIPLAFFMILDPESVPLFLQSGYQLAVQMVSAALLYFVPDISEFFQASPKARKRAFDHEWEKNSKETKA